MAFCEVVLVRPTGVSAADSLGVRLLLENPAATSSGISECPPESAAGGLFDVDVPTSGEVFPAGALLAAFFLIPYIFAGSRKG